MKVYCLVEDGEDEPSKFFRFIDNAAEFLGIDPKELNFLTDGAHVTDKNGKTWILWIGIT